MAQKESSASTTFEILILESDLNMAAIVMCIHLRERERESNPITYQRSFTQKAMVKNQTCEQIFFTFKP